MDGDLFTATADDGSLRWHAAVETDGAWARTAPPGLDALADALALPIAGRRADGSWVESYFRLGFGDALLRPARAVLWFDTAMIPGLEPQVCHAPWGAALAMRGMTWRLTHRSSAGGEAPARNAPGDLPRLDLKPRFLVAGGPGSARLVDGAIHNGRSVSGSSAALTTVWKSGVTTCTGRRCAGTVSGPE